ncbi:MAG: glutathione S-transferase N-terminal domain-containing protein [Pseudobdellovibrionaceae bacterium]
MKLYFSPGACSLAPHIILRELELPFEAVRVDLKHKSEHFKKLNPKGYVPVLVTSQEKILTEAAVILQYLADLKPEKNLFPKAGWERYKGSETLHFISTEFHKTLGPLWSLSKTISNAEGAEQYRKAVIEKMSKNFHLMADNLKKNTFVLGPQFTICDAYLYTVLTWTRPLKIDLSPWPELIGYLESIGQRPAVQLAAKTEGLKTT